MPKAPVAPRLPKAFIPAPPQLEPAGDWSGLELTGDHRSQDAHQLIMEQSTARGAVFASADLSGARLTDVGFSACDLSGTILVEARVTRAVFTDCRLAGAGLAGAQLQDVRFVQCRMDEVDLRMSHGSRICMEDCRLGGADFYGCQWEEAALFDCDLTGAEFSKAALRDVRLHGSRVERLKGAQYLGGATISTGQVLSVAVQVFSALGISVDDQREP